VLASKLPTWCNGAASPASVNGLTFVGWQEPIGCGGCAVFPGDVIVCDDDGAVVIPQNLVSFVAEEGAEHERMETWIVGEVERGAKLPGLYPMNDEIKGATRLGRRDDSPARPVSCSSRHQRFSVSSPFRPTW
jgi:regulator of RNase E activity RraA